MSKSKLYVNCFGSTVVSGEIWFDRAGNECFFRDNGTISCRTVNDEPSMTIQSERDKLDIEIVKGIYEKHRHMYDSRTAADTLKYGGFQSGDDYHTLLLRAQDAQDDFMTLDARIRDRFDNDPGKLLDYVRDPNNRLEAIQLGLMIDDGSSPQAPQVPQGDKPAPSKEGVI